MYGATITALLGSVYIGICADRISRFGLTLLSINLGAAACSAALAFMPRFELVVTLVVSATILSLSNAILIRRLLPIYFSDTKLRRASAMLTEIAAIGPVFGPLFGPVFPLLNISLSSMYLIDAVCFFVTAFVYLYCFNLNSFPVTRSATDCAPSANFFSTTLAVIEQVRSGKLQVLVIAYIPFSFGMSTLFFSLAVFNKEIANGNEFAFALPILSMFLGRTAAARYARSRYFSTTYPRFFAIGASFALASLFAIAFSKTVALFSILQFFLGIGVSTMLFAHTMWLQHKCDSDSLGMANGGLRTIDAASKLIGIPLVAALTEHAYLWPVAIIIGCAFGLSGLLALRTVEVGDVGETKNFIPEFPK